MTLTNRELANNSTFPVAMEFLACQYCNYLRNDLDDRIDIPCPICGKPGYRQSFPGISAVTLLEMIAYFYAKACDVIDEQESSLVRELKEKTGKILSARSIVQVSREIKAFCNNSKDKNSQETYDRILQLIHDQLSISLDKTKPAFPPIFAYSDTVHEHKVVVILTSTLLEELLTEQLVLLRALKGMKRPDAWKQVEELNGLKRLCEDFKQFTGVTIASAIGQCPIKDFYSHWSKIVKLRNTFIHGIPYAIDAGTAEIAFNLAKNSFPLFAHLQNRFCVTKRRSPQTI